MIRSAVDDRYLQSIAGATEIESGVFLIACSGRLSWEDRGALSRQIDRLLRAHNVRSIILDMQDVHDADSAGLGAMIQVVRLVNAAGSTIQFANVPNHLHRLLQVIRIDELAISEANGHAAASANAMRGSSVAGSAPLPESPSRHRHRPVTIPFEAAGAANVSQAAAPPPSRISDR
jgi:anti-anti-sigma factor